jgi:hypothetical protein
MPSRGAPRLPTFLIIGAAKSGTTSLYQYLVQHPAVFMPDLKEPHFWSWFGHPPGDRRSWLLDRPPEALTTVEAYAGLFAKARTAQVALGEASTGYLCDPRAPQIIHDHLPAVRSIALLRDPIERAWSDFRMMRREGLEPESDFVRAVQLDADGRYVHQGAYGSALRRWLAAYPAEQLHVRLFDDLVADPRALVQGVLRFLGLRPMELDVRSRHNAAPDQAPVPEGARARLLPLFLGEIQLTAELLGRDLTPWMRTVG